jgi:hypothetical protein
VTRLFRIIFSDSESNGITLLKIEFQPALTTVFFQMLGG